MQREDHEPVLVPREGVNDDEATLLRWLVANRHWVAANDPIAELETTKACFEIGAPREGYLIHAAKEGERIPIGSAIAVVADSPEAPPVTNPSPQPLSAATTTRSTNQIISAKARAIIESEQLPLDAFSGLAVVREEDVRKFLAGSQSTETQSRRFRDLPLDLERNWEEVLQDPLYRQLQALLLSLRMRMKAQHNRDVSTSQLLHDRWEKARDYGFGEDTSVYDDVLILGQVQVGKRCWIGPNAILDGSGGLQIGDYVDVGAGAHIYSHNTIQRALTGYAAQVFYNPTRIGNCCFIAPHAVISAGTVLGDHTFVAVGSYVEGSFPPYSYLAGNPARRAGRVVIEGRIAKIIRDTDKEGKRH
jgi:acetyltransferase-like isoleucine patch superfamily enzyme